MNPNTDSSGHYGYFGKQVRHDLPSLEFSIIVLIALSFLDLGDFFLLSPACCLPSQLISWLTDPWLLKTTGWHLKLVSLLVGSRCLRQHYHWQSEHLLRTRLSSPLLSFCTSFVNIMIMP